MVIFIDDRPIRIVKKKMLGEMPSKEDFDLVLDARLSPLKVENFSGHTCIINAEYVMALGALQLPFTW
jgi:hypothetical protein